MSLATQENMAVRPQTIREAAAIGIEVAPFGLGMRPMPMPARTTGDHQAEYVVLLGLLASTGCRCSRRACARTSTCRAA